jgi:uncharacterized protein YdeI (YjbR/CyaY-like superfamily)
MQPTFFETENDFRDWLEHNHAIEPELLVGFYKTSSDKESITWPQSVDQALCFGWIDGVRKSFTKDSYTIRFTPRRESSIWSAVNIKKIGELQQQGLMKPEGLAAFKKRKESKSKIYSHERAEPAKLPAAWEEEFKGNDTAWEFFINQAPSYRQAVLHLIETAKQEKTKRSRFEKLMAASLQQKRL